MSFVKFGFDVSKYQVAINFQTMKSYGAQFVILRAGYALAQDERIAQYLPAVAGVLPFNLYHYYDPLYAPTEQAKKIISILAPWRGQFSRLWLDFEFNWPGAYTAPAHWLTYRNAIEAAGYPTGIYTRKTWWDARVGSLAAEFAQRPLWVAQYSSVLTMIPAGWTRPMLWQDGTPTIGAQVGVGSAEVDHDLWNDEFDFAAEWLNLAPPIGDPMVETHQGLVQLDLNVRSGPGTTYPQKLPPLGLLHKGDVVYGVLDSATQWFHFDRIVRVTGVPETWDAWASAASTTYMHVSAYTPAPPPAATTSLLEVTWDAANKVSGVKVDGVPWVKP